MLQRSPRWVVLAVTMFALAAVAGDTRASAVSPVVEAPVVTAFSADSDVAAPSPQERSSAVSRSLIRSEVPASATVTEPEPQPAPEAVAPAVEAKPVPVAPAPAVPATCSASQFCYPRVGIAGTIVPYNDCTGSTDVGTAIRSLTCVSQTYLAAHAYTQFGRIAGWRAGDVVFAFGTRYVIYDAFTQEGCVPPARALAALSLQTSLTPATCGPILVVQGQPG